MRKRYKIILVLLIIFISIGFAYLTANLDITGTIAFRENTWDVHLDNIVVENDSLDADTPIINNSKDSVNFTVSFTRPGDYYEFYVDVINAGTMDATLQNISKTNLTGDYVTYLNYNITYYSSRPITEGDLLRAGCKERIKVRVEYKYDLDTYQRLNNINLSFRLNYIKTDTHSSTYNSKIWNFDSKAEEDAFIVPKTGTYKLEVWGAQGGNGYNLKLLQSSAIGGYGGYSSGNIILNKDNTIYITVGEKGIDCTKNIFAADIIGGYNGGGNGGINSDSGWGSGGGATHIATRTGKLSTLMPNSLTGVGDILIVAGAGGGAGTYVSMTTSTTNINDGGSGGGYIGSAGKQTTATGGTQTSGGVGLNTNWKGLFGTGGTSTQVNQGSGGGGGYYGGAAGWDYGSSAGGGSGYIGNNNLTDKIMYCYNCQSSVNEADETHIKTRSTTNISETPTSNYAKIGHGYARITFIG